MIYDVKFSTKFKKDIKLVQRQGKNVDKLFDAVDILARGEALPPKYKDHNLVGDYDGCRECHIEPDWLLIYKVNEKEIILTLTRTGSHSELFN
jgi:mRNA interferase YafQ